MSRAIHINTISISKKLLGAFWCALFFVLNPLQVFSQSPSITYTPLSNTCVTGDRELIATITDAANGIPLSGNGLPVLYWKVNPEGAYNAAVSTFLGADQYKFTFGGSAGLGNIVYYYIVAQNNEATPIVVSKPSIGASGFSSSPPAVSSPPTTPEYFVVQQALASGIYTVGAAGNYITITDAVNAYNNSCSLNGPITFVLSDANYSAETFPIIISNPDASATNTLTIKPNTLVNTTISGTSSEALIKFNGADYITIDGSNNGTSTRNLTFKNNSTVATSSVLWVASFSSSNGATYNTIKNCIISGNASTTTFAGISSAGGSSIVSMADAPNSYNVYFNDSVSTCYNAFYINGALAGETGNTISNAGIGSTILINKLGYRAVFLSNQNDFLVNNNNITGVNSNVFLSSDPDASGGIFISGNCSNGKVFANKIYDIRNTNTSGAPSYGISLQSNLTASGVKVYNNFIYQVSGYGSTSQILNNGHGIMVLSGGGYDIQYNSINFSFNQTIAGITSNIFIATSVVGLIDLRNNIFYNYFTTSPTGTRYSIYCSVPRSVFSYINYNDYFCSGVLTLGFLGGNRSNIGAWQAATLSDGNSVSVDPRFKTSTDLHLSDLSTLNNQGTPIIGITRDIDSVSTAIPGDLRSLTTPDIGGDEFTPTACSGNVGGVAVLITSNVLCTSGQVILTCTGFTTGTGMEYQWQYSTDNITWNTLVGETNPTIANPTTNITSYYRLKVVCSAGTPGYSTSILVTVQNPQLLSTTPSSRCGEGTVTLAANATAGSTIQWFNDVIGGAALGSSTPFTTPYIFNSTTFYAQASYIGNSGSCGPVSPTALNSTSASIQLTPHYVFFNILQSTTLASVDVFPMAAGQVFYLEVYNPSLVPYSPSPAIYSPGVKLASFVFITSVSGGATPQTVPINLFFLPGNEYALKVTRGDGIDDLGAGFMRNTSGAVYPYNSTDLSITGNSFIQTYFMNLYNWKFFNGCSLGRTSVLATIDAAPQILASATSSNVCKGTSTTLNVSSLNAAYNYSWTPGSFTGNSINVSPVINTSYVVTGNDGICIFKDTVDITIAESPSQIIFSPTVISRCAGTAAQNLFASGGTIGGTTIFSEGFESPGTNGLPDGWANGYVSGFSTTSWLKAPPFPATTISNPYYLTFPSGATIAFKSNDSSKFYLATSDIPNNTLNNVNATLRTPLINTAGYASLTLSFWHNFNKYDLDSISIELSTNGTAWTGLYSYKSISLGLPNKFIQNFIDLTSYAGQSFYVRFRYRGKFAFHWAIDNVLITGTTNIPPVSWSPISGLFTNAAGTIPYTAGSILTSVYVNPASTTTYTAASTSPNGCVTNNSIIVNVKPVFSTGAINSTGETICYSGDPALISSITAASGGDNLISYQWQISTNNGTTFTNIVGATAASYDPPAGLIVTSIYKRLAKDASCNTTLTSSSGTWQVIVRPIFSAGTISSTGETICYNGDPVLIVSTTPASGGDNAIIYKWQANGVDIPSSNAATYDPPAGLTTSTTYTRYAKEGICNTTFILSSGSWLVTVRPAFSAGTISSVGETICYNGDPAIISSITAASGGNNVITYKWQANGTDILGAIAATYDPPAGLTVTTTYTRFAKDGICSTSFIQSAGSYLVTLRPVVSGIITGSTTICQNGTANLSIALTGNAPWTLTYTRNGLLPVTITNILSSPYILVANPGTTTTQYKITALTDAGGCSATASDISSVATVTVSGEGSVWLGFTSDWSDGNNWCGGVPDADRDVTISSGTPNAPIISAVTVALSRKVYISSGASLSIINGGSLSLTDTLNLSGTISNNGSIIFNGISSQSFTGTTSSIISAMNILEVNKPSGTMAIDKKVTITGILKPKAGVITLNDTITLKSDATATASIDKIGASASFEYGIKGRFIVERFIPTGLNHQKSWQLLSVPTFGQTVKEAWQEGAVNVSSNPKPGYGTTFTSNLVGALSAGFDFYTPAGSTMKVYDDVSNNYIGIANTNSLSIANPKGYMVFVRGDRSILSSSTPANVVTLRTTGKVYAKGVDAPPIISVRTGKFQSVGNLFASAIDFTSLLSSSLGLNTTYYVWDPLLSSGIGYGGFQTISAANSYLPIPGQTANYPSDVVCSKIQSGQAFFVYSTSGGTVNFSEENKIVGSQMVFRVADNPDRSFLRLYLYGTDGSLEDGNVVIIDSTFDNGFDINDAIKLPNFAENIGIKNNNRVLAIDSRKSLTIADTILYEIGNLKSQTYQFRIAPENLLRLGLTAIFVDKYTQQQVPLSLTDSTFFTFSANSDVASKAPGRFYIIFRQMILLPITFTHIKAQLQEKQIAVDWEVENETGIQQYDIQKSSDGVHFVAVASQSPRFNNGNNAFYQQIDENPFTGYNYYRIRSIANNGGGVAYSKIVKVWVDEREKMFSVHPNPVKDNQFNVLFSNQVAGNYKIELFNNAGQLVFVKTIAHAGGNKNYSIQPSVSLSKGAYLLKISGLDNVHFTSKLIVE